jgi:hypothetical protein
MGGQSVSQTLPRLYGVSHGNGNDGVSHIFADYYVHTDDPWRLARLALAGQFKLDWIDKALAEADVDGDDDYTIYATIYNPLDWADEDGECSWCEANGAWHITEVFPATEPRQGKMIYPSLEEAFSADLLAKVIT